jgi:hypothetical protein
MVTFDNPDVADVAFSVVSSGRTTITVTYQTGCGSKTDSLTLVLTDDVTVVGFVDAGPISLPDGASDAVTRTLSNPASCAATINTWVLAGATGAASLAIPQVDSDVDRRYANAFLNSRSANPSPPLALDPASFMANQALYRAFNRLRVYFESGPSGIRQDSVTYLRRDVSMGATPEPCSGGQVVALGVETDSQVIPRRSTASVVYQVVQGRIGSSGQQANAYLNKRNLIGPSLWFTATPYIWSAITFDANGNLLPFDAGGRAQIFPTYYVYRNGILSDPHTVIQSPVEPFIGLDWTSSFSPPR